MGRDARDGKRTSATVPRRRDDDLAPAFAVRREFSRVSAGSGAVVMKRSAAAFDWKTNQTELL
jgi:hypothetical protein